MERIQKALESITVLTVMIIGCALPLFASGEHDEADKQNLISKFLAEASKAQETGVEFSPASAEVTCGDPSATVTDCRKAIRASKKELKAALQKHQEMEPKVVVVAPHIPKTETKATLPR